VSTKTNSETIQLERVLTFKDQIEINCYVTLYIFNIFLSVGNFIYQAV